MFAKILLSRLPVDYQFWQKFGLFRHGEMGTAQYALDVFENNVFGFENKSVRQDNNGRIILELGPGDSIATAIIAFSYGMKATLLDVGAYAKNSDTIYIPLCNELAKRGLSPPSLEACGKLEDHLKACNARYLTNGLASLRQIKTESVDHIFSQAVLEHIRRSEFLEMMRECRRILKPGGLCSHRVDLRDHLSGKLNNLRFSTSFWESDFIAKSGFYTNRIRFKEMKNLFDRAGFSILSLKIDKWPKLPTKRSYMNNKFADCDVEDLLVKGFNVLIERK